MSEAEIINTPAIVPTLGIEIELPWSTMLDRVCHKSVSKILRESGGFYELSGERKATVQSGFDKVDSVYLPKVEEAKRLDIPVSGSDGFAEFALLPRDTPGEIIYDVDQLYGIGLLSRGEKYPLHITIGNIAANASAAYLLCSLEVIGDIDAARITQKNTWNVKGRGGMKTRLASELSRGAQRGVEFRTLELHSRHQLKDMLDIAHVGAHAIMKKEPLWDSWKDTLNSKIRDHGLPTTEFWQRSDVSLWERYGQLLNDSDWRTDTKRTIGRHAALLACLNNDLATHRVA